MSLLCFTDHGGSGGREIWGDLGLPEEIWRTHFAADWGAAEIASTLASRAGGEALINPVSRLFADTNRDPADATCVPTSLGDIAVPGNAALDIAERVARIRAIHEPFHRKMVTHLTAHEQRFGERAIALSIHSFTPEYHGKPRRTHIGLLVKHDPATAENIREALCASFPQLVIEYDAPYAGWLYNYTVDRHLGDRTMSHALLEFRQDLAMDPGFRARLAEALLPALQAIAARGWQEAT